MSTLKILTLLLCLLTLAHSWQLSAVPCDVDNCTHCDQTKTTCLACEDGFFLDDSNQKCSTCDSAIPNCQLCTLNDTQTPTCDSCEKGYYPFNSGDSCRSCMEAIPDCIDCSVDVNQKVTCGQCVPDQFPDQTAEKCSTCGILVPHCLSCELAPKFEHTKCMNCQQDYEPSESRTECVEKGSSKTWIIIVAILGALILIGIVIIVIKFCQRKKKDNTLLQDQDEPEQA